MTLPSTSLVLVNITICNVQSGELSEIFQFLSHGPDSEWSAACKRATETEYVPASRWTDLGCRRLPDIVEECHGTCIYVGQDGHCTMLRPTYSFSVRELPVLMDLVLRRVFVLANWTLTAIYHEQHEHDDIEAKMTAYTCPRRADLSICPQRPVETINADTPAKIGAYSHLCVLRECVG